jgi:hypothetical protein
MKILKEIIYELFGLFVDDGSLAYATTGWILVGIFILPVTGLPPEHRAVIWVLGILFLLVENIARSARKIRRARLKKPPLP